MAGNYSSIEHQAPYGSGDPYHNSSTEFIASPIPPRRKEKRNVWKIVLPIILLIIIVAAVVGGVVGSRKRSKTQSNTSVASPEGASSVASRKNSTGRYATATDSEFMVPIYPSTVCICLCGM